MKEEFDKLIYDFLSGSIAKEDLQGKPVHPDTRSSYAHPAFV